MLFHGQRSQTHPASSEDSKGESQTNVQALEKPHPTAQDSENKQMSALLCMTMFHETQQITGREKSFGQASRPL